MASVPANEYAGEVKVPIEVIAVTAPFVVNVGVDVASSAIPAGIVLTITIPCAGDPVSTKWIATWLRPPGRAVKVTVLAALANMGVITKPAVFVLVPGEFKSEIWPAGCTRQPQLKLAVFTVDTQLEPKVSVTV